MPSSQISDIHLITVGKENFSFKDQIGNNTHLRTVAPGLVGGDHHVGGHEEGPVLCGWHNVVRLVPHPVVELPDVGGQGHGENVLQGGLGVTLDLTKIYIFKIN